MKTTYTKSLVVAASFILGFSMSAFAAQNSGKAYIGMQLGSADMHYNKSSFNNTEKNTLVENGTVNSADFGQRGLVGYKFNPYFAVEAGYTHYGKTKGNGLNYSDGTLGVSGTIKEQSIEFLGKAIWPLAKEVNLYAKVGIAEVMADVKNDDGLDKKYSGLKPAFAVGATFNITHHYSVDVSYNRIESGSKLPKSAELLGLGFYYYFG